MATTYIKGVTTGPPIDLSWTNAAGTAIDFSTGYTFSATIAKTSTPTVLEGTKTSGITGYADDSTGYNVRIGWVTADFAGLDAGPTDYRVRLVATPGSGDPFEFPGRIVFTLDPATA